MTSVFASRRRAEEFSSLVEASAPRELRSAELEEFLAVVESLRAIPLAEPRPDFVGSLRADLMAAADILLLPAAHERLTLPPRTARRDRRIAAAIGGIAVVGASTSMAVAAQSALPGEMLYPLKRAIEDAGTDVASGRDTAGLTLLDNASSRLAEVAALGREGELAGESSAVASNLVDFGDQATRATGLLLDEHAETGDRELIRELRDFAGASMTSLQDLESLVPPSAHDELRSAVDIVRDIDAQARQACPSCGGEGVDQIPPVLLGSAAIESGTVVIPGATVTAWRSTGDDRRARSAPRPGSGRSPVPVPGASKSGGDEEPLPTDAIVTAPETDPPATDGGSDPDNPVADLADGAPATSRQGSADAGKTLRDATGGGLSGRPHVTNKLGNTPLDDLGIPLDD